MSLGEIMNGAKAEGYTLWNRLDPAKMKDGSKSMSVEESHCTSEEAWVKERGNALQTVMALK